MKNALFLIALSIFLFTGNCFSQSNTGQNKINKIYLNPQDAFLVELSIDTIYEHDLFEVGKTYFKVCKITINNVFFMHDTSYVSKRELKGARFLLIPDSVNVTMRELRKMSLYASKGKRFYFFGRFLNENEINADKYQYHAILRWSEPNNKKLKKFIKKMSKE